MEYKKVAAALGALKLFGKIILRIKNKRNIFKTP